MALRPSMIDEIPMIDALDRELFADQDTYPFRRPVFGYYAARTLAGNLQGLDVPEHSPGRKFWAWLTNLLGFRRRQNEELLLAAMDMQFFSLFRQGHLAGFMVLRNWVDQSDFSRGGCDERDSEVMYVGVAPAFRGTGLGTEALDFALHYHAQRHRHRTTLARFQPGCTVFRGMLDRRGFTFHPQPQNGRTIGFRYSFETLIKIPRPE